ncbi:hypothetical protein APTSU1_000654200 [Apodemus speciosus]|uniref:Uncharacterized protein n=1 Tax=Apodemus speciosus TaxID=105296 RepID=A0ABQ0EW85_APOSI
MFTLGILWKAVEPTGRALRQQRSSFSGKNQFVANTTHGFCHLFTEYPFLMDSKETTASLCILASPFSTSRSPQETLGEAKIKK